MMEIQNKISDNIDSLNYYDSLYISNPIATTTSIINYYQNQTPLYNKPLNNSIISLYNENNEILNNQNNSQTPVMDFNINNSISENQTNKNEIFKSEIKSFDTSESSKNIEIEILPRIENIVSTANLCCKLNLREIAMQAKMLNIIQKDFLL